MTRITPRPRLCPHVIILFGLFTFLLWPASAAAQAPSSTGLVFADEDTYRDIPLATTPLRGTLPRQKDLSAWFPRPGQQGRQASCVGWAVGYGLKSYQEAVERRQRPSDTGRVFSPAYVYNQIRIGSCQSGSQIYDALNLLRREGVATMEAFPYDAQRCQRTPGEATRDAARPFTIADWRRVDVDNAAEVKSQIANGFPVVIGMYVDEGFQRLQAGSVYRQSSGASLGGHAMVVVGYDDSRRAYKVLNSWGTGWADGGFGWIGYDIFAETVREAYTAQDVVLTDPEELEPRTEPRPTLDPPSDLFRPDPAPDLPPLPTTTPNATATLQAPQVFHNQQVPGRAGPTAGMVIRVPGVIRNGRGSQAQMLVRFYLDDGRPLLANAQEQLFRDMNGLVATGTPPGTVTSNQRTLSHIVMTIPYYALNFQPTGGQRRYAVRAQVTLYIDQFEKAQSPMVPMTIRY